jgi:hypothetical protein
MGDFSREPNVRLKDSIKKRYVGVRMQQGVPVLDADWNEMEDLRKHELNELFKQFIGGGVPTGNNGFCICALDKGGAGTIVLTAPPDETEFASLEIDFSNSTAASVLGFWPGKAYTEHYGSSPARLTGNAAEPFILTDGMTLTVKINGSDGQTVTFSEDDFQGEDENIAEAAAGKVVDIINASLTGASAQIGPGNDFIITGGTAENPGRILVEGVEALNETDIVYSSQPLFENEKLAEKWDVDVVPALQPLSDSDRDDVVYIDVWEREVDYLEDKDLFQEVIGLETTVRLKREWVVRVAEGAADLSGITRKPGHRYLPLARLHRKQNDNKITVGSILDLRKQQLKLADNIVSPIRVMGEFGIDKVNSGLFENMMRSTSRVYLGLLESDFFLATNFSTINGAQSVKVLRAFQDVRNTAEYSAVDAHFQRLDNNAALELMHRLYLVQRNFVDSMRPMAEDLTTEEDGTLPLLDSLDTWLEGNGDEIPGLRESVDPEASPHLGNAYDAQIFINKELKRRAGVGPSGMLDIQFVGGPTGIINAGALYEFTYSIKSELNIDDTIELAVTDTKGLFGFEFKGLDGDSNYPDDLSHAVLLLGVDQTVNVSFDVIIPPGLPIGSESRLILNARSQNNPGDIDFANVEITVKVGSQIALPSTLLELFLLGPIINLAKDIQPIGRTSDGGFITFTIQINYNVEDTIEDEFEFTVDFIGNESSFEVLGAFTLSPFPISGTIGIEGINRQIPIGAVNSASDGQESLMIIRLAKTDPALTEPFFRELPIRIITDIPGE